MLKIYPNNINELKKQKKRTYLRDMVNFDNSEIYVLFDSSNMINLSNKISDKLNKSTKYFKILDKTPFYILKIESDIYLIKRNKIKEVKKYIYKNKINKNILLSNIIDPNITKNTYQMLEKGLQIEQLELIDVKDINSIEEFKILTLKNKEESKIVKKNEFRGRAVATGLPQSFEITNNEILEALSEPLGMIVNCLRTALEQTPPELSSDIAQNGLVVTGGGALLEGVDKLIHSRTNLPVSLADDPLTCVARGGGIALEMINQLDMGFLAAE